MAAGLGRSAKETGIKKEEKKQLLSFTWVLYFAECLLCCDGGKSIAQLDKHGADHADFFCIFAFGNAAGQGRYG